MVRSQSIYPTTGYTTAPPFVPDPMALVPFQFDIPYLDVITGVQRRRLVNMGIHWDDNVWNSGGICQNLENWLEIYWRQTCAEYVAANSHAATATLSEVQTEVSHTYTLANLVYCTVTVFNTDPSRSYWWGTSKVSKYGSYQFRSNEAFYEHLGFLNSELNAISAPSGELFDGIRVNILGPNPLALVELWELKGPPDITFTGWQGLTGFYNSNGVTYL